MSHHHTAVQLANCSILQDQRQRSFCLRSRSSSSSVEQLVDKAGLSADENDHWINHNGTLLSRCTRRTPMHYRHSICIGSTVLYNQRVWHWQWERQMHGYKDPLVYRSPSTWTDTPHKEAIQRLSVDRRRIARGLVAVGHSDAAGINASLDVWTLGGR